MKIVAFLILITAVAYAQMPAAQKPKSDTEKLASAMQAGPKFVTQNATVLDWPSSAASSAFSEQAPISRRCRTRSERRPAFTMRPLIRSVPAAGEASDHLIRATFFRLSENLIGMKATTSSRESFHPRPNKVSLGAALVVSLETQ